MSEKRRGLGRGLGALIPATPASGTGDRPVDVFFPGKSEGDGAAAGRGATGVLTQERPPAVTAPEARHTDGRLPGEGHVVRPAVPGVPGHAPGLLRAPGQQRPESGGASSVSGDPAAAVIDGDHASVAPGTVDISRPAQPGAEARDGVELVPVPGAEFAELAVGAIRPNPRQPRQVFDEEALAELVHSVREIGVLQPVVVRRVEPENGEPRYELIMGERRWRATKEAGLDRIPAIIRDTADDQMLRDALLENLHRSELNPLEEAAAYQQLLEDFGCTHEELATKIGRSRPQISNTIRLLRLPPQVQRRVAAGVLSAGHARSLLGLEDTDAMERLAARIVSEGLSVRAVEEIVALGDGPVAKPAKRRPRAGTYTGELNDLAGRLGDRLDTRVSIALGKTRGKLTIDFASVDDLNRILGLMSPEVRGAFKG
ncbi:MAG TPA: ParB/RepB/Spo0J family partition protein [Kineosporiaceae bacterium]|nr:ParB/RepB/Spo0J family partition protein [Kineosporiaceae bacterium]